MFSTLFIVSHKQKLHNSIRDLLLCIRWCKICYKTVLGVFILAITGKVFYSFCQTVCLLKVSVLLERRKYGFQELQYLAEPCRWLGHKRRKQHELFCACKLLGQCFKHININPTIVEHSTAELFCKQSFVKDEDYIRDCLLVWHPCVDGQVQSSSQGSYDKHKLHKSHSHL